MGGEEAEGGGGNRTPRNFAGLNRGGVVLEQEIE